MFKLLKIWKNKELMAIALKAMRFSKDGFNRVEITHLLEDLLNFLRVPVSITYKDDEIIIKIKWGINE